LKPGEGVWKRHSDEMVPGRSLFFVGCRDIVLENITLVDSAGGWFTWFLDCDNLRISGVKMFADVRLPNTDGIHLGSCRNVVISDCDLHNGDDSIVIRSMQEQFSEPKPSENIVVSNCILSSRTSGIILGFAHDYMIKNCVFSNLVVSGMFAELVSIITPSVAWSESKDPPRYPDTPRPYPEIRPLIIEDISFNNINVQIGGPLLWIEFDPEMPVDHVSGIVFRGVQGCCGNWPCIRNRPGQRVSDIEFRDIRLDVLAPTKQANWRKPSESFEFGNAENIILDGVRIRKASNVSSRTP